MNKGSSPYHAIQGLFCRGSHEELLVVEGRNAEHIRKHWSSLRTQMGASGTKFTTLPSGARVDTTPVEISGLDGLCPYLDVELHTHHVRETYHKSKGCYVGLLSCHLSAIGSDKIEFRDWLETFFLLETSLWPQSYDEDRQNEKAYRIAEDITALFETTLRNIASNDEWSIGRDLFLRRVLGFVARNERIQMGVPAFPCKSPNTRKVGGQHPDMAERIAMETLHTFAQNVKKIYSPGATMWVISDGHVFSDCIGVDDQIVSDYDEDLKTTYQSMFTSMEDHETIRFRGLTDMFFSNPDVTGTLSDSWSQNFEILHPINSNHTTKAETARRIMMAGCQASREHFQKLIADQHPPTLSLYRGQARFMQDDLATPDFLAKSTKQKKKTSFLVAAEMIARNQAYSNLVELLLPNYVRLSIHAHTNKGPKFGICLFPRDKIRAIDSIKNRHELVPAYEFQVPTPWHNSIIRVAGDSTIYLGKAEIVQAAIDQGEFKGGWVESPEGAHFALTSTSPVIVTDAHTIDKVPTITKIEIEETPISSRSSTTTKVGGDEKAPAITKTETIEVPVSSGSSMATKVGEGEKGSAITKTEVEIEVMEGPSLQGRRKVRFSFIVRGTSYRTFFSHPLRYVKRVMKSQYSTSTVA